MVSSPKRHPGSLCLIAVALTSSRVERDHGALHCSCRVTAALAGTMRQMISREESLRRPFGTGMEDLYWSERPHGESQSLNGRVTGMIFRQLFDSVSGTYTYLSASRPGGEALIVDPVLEKVDRYIQLVDELDLKLVKAVDTHLHADHLTGLGALRDRTHCVTVMGER